MNAFKLITITMAFAASLTLAGCGQLGFTAANNSSDNTSQSTPDPLAALNALSTVAGEIDLHFDLVEDVDVFVLPFAAAAGLCGRIHNAAQISAHRLCFGYRRPGNSRFGDGFAYKPQRFVI